MATSISNALILRSNPRVSHESDRNVTVKEIQQLSNELRKIFAHLSIVMNYNSCAEVIRSFKTNDELRKLNTQLFECQSRIRSISSALHATSGKIDRLPSFVGINKRIETAFERINGACNRIKALENRASSNASPQGNLILRVSSLELKLISSQADTQRLMLENRALRNSMTKQQARIEELVQSSNTLYSWMERIVEKVDYLTQAADQSAYIAQPLVGQYPTNDPTQQGGYTSYHGGEFSTPPSY